ncbi:hypothetical protein BGZ76_007265 [Entomortierella beljakovae]|nr:hypothetical protein BGZ76_007265 [Entomortierella beljakovae]
MVIEWSKENDDGRDDSIQEAQSSSCGKSSSDTTTTTDSSSQRSGTDSIQQKRVRSSTRTSKRKKQSFVVQIKGSFSVDFSIEDETAEVTSLPLGTGFKKFQLNSKELVLPAPLSVSDEEYKRFLNSLRSIYSPTLDTDQHLLEFDVQLILEKKESGMKVMDDLINLYGGNDKRKQTVLVWMRLLPIFYNIEADSGNDSKSEHGNGVRPDFFIEVPCRTLTSIFNSEIVGLLGEVKPPEKDRREIIKIHDFWKLIRMGKDEIKPQIK